MATEDSAWFDSRPLPANMRDHLDSFPVEDVIDAVVERCAGTVFPQQASDEQFIGRLKASVSQNVCALRDVLSGRSELTSVQLDKALDFATVQAHLRIPQKSMQRSYRLSFYTQWELWAAHAHEWLDEIDAPREVSLAVQARLTRCVLAYQEHVASLVAETYTRDYEALNRSRAHLRRSLIRELLEQEGTALSAADVALLGYPLTAHHVVVLLPELPEAAASQLVDTLRSASASHQTLVYALSLGSTAVWLARLQPWSVPALRSITDVLEKAGARACVSNSGVGVESFATCLRQARDVERVRSAWGADEAPAVVSYADVGLEVLLLQDEGLARTFVEAELGVLGATTADAVRLRDTLEASFRFGSHVAAAHHLRLHEHTVRNRLQKAEALLGHSLQDRRTELQVALRLVRLLGPSD